MKLSQLKPLRESSDQDDQELHPDAQQWLQSIGITNYDVIGSNIIDVNQDINWGTLERHPTSSVHTIINHVSGNFTWVTDKRLTKDASVLIDKLLPKTVSGDCTIKCESTGTRTSIPTSVIPKGTGRGTLTIECTSPFEMALLVDNNFTATYADYKIQVSMISNSSHGLNALPSPWNGSLTVTCEDSSPLILPSVINGNLWVTGDDVGFNTFAKIHQRVSRIKGELYVQGNGPLPLISLFRIKGITQFSCGIWDVDENGNVIDEDTPLSQTITRMFNNALQDGDVIEFQETLIDSGYKAWAK